MQKELALVEEIEMYHKNQRVLELDKEVRYHTLEMRLPHHVI
jgi:hypothetical protein